MIKRKVKYIFLVLFLGGCSFIETPKELIETEPTFSEDPIYNFKTRIEEGWEIRVYNGKIIFIRQTENGIETYRPIK